MEQMMVKSPVWNVPGKVRFQSHLLDEFQQLRLGGTRITQHQNVDISSQSHAVGKHFTGASEKETADGFLDIWRPHACENRPIDHSGSENHTCASKDAGGNAARQEIVNVPAARHGLVFELLFLGKVPSVTTMAARLGVHTNDTDIGAANSHGSRSFL
jgi:hypothetical protein